MRNICSLILITFLLTACTDMIPYYKPEIQQGNIITQSQVNQLKLGMTRTQVIHLLGEPVVKNSFKDDELAYIYTDEPNLEPRAESKLILYFNSNNKLVSGEGSYRLPF
jgi:outer membrane protein assembly factor BamE